MKKIFAIAVALFCTMMQMTATEYCKIAGKSITDAELNKNFSVGTGTAKVTFGGNMLRVILDDVNYTGMQPLIDVESDSYMYVQVQCYGANVANVSYNHAIRSNSKLMLVGNRSNDINASLILSADFSLACVNSKSLNVILDSGEHEFLVTIKNIGSGSGVSIPTSGAGMCQLEKGVDLLISVPNASSVSHAFIGGSAFDLEEGMAEENGATLSSDYVYKVNGQEVSSLHFSSTDAYGVKINNTNITGLNARDVIHDGHFYYRKDEKTLYYAGDATASYISINGAGQLTIAAAGSESTLSVHSPSAGTALAIRDNGGLVTFKGGVVSLIGQVGTENDQAIYGYNKASLAIEDGADVTITLMDLSGTQVQAPGTYTGAVKGFVNLTMPEGYVIDGGSWSATGKGIMTADNKYANPVHIHPAASAIHNVRESNSYAKKLVNGQLVLIRDNQTYNVSGMKIQ